MNSNTPSRWDDPAVKIKSKGALETAASAGGWFIALPRGVKIAIVVLAVMLLAGLTGTVLGWAFALLAFLGRLILLTLGVVIILAVLRKKN